MKLTDGKILGRKAFVPSYEEKKRAAPGAEPRAATPRPA